MLRRKAKYTNASNILARLQTDGSMVAFDEDMFGTLVDCVIVHKDRFVFRLKDGRERSVRC